MLSDTRGFAVVRAARRRLLVDAKVIAINVGGSELD